MHEFTSVCGFGRWADCLNQDLLDFVGFSGWWVSSGTGVVVRAFTRVYESFGSVDVFGRWVDCLNQDLLDFCWIFGMVGVFGYGCGRMSVYERLRELA